MAEPGSGSDVARLTAQFDDQLSRLEALEAERDAQAALRRFVQGDLSLSELSAHVTALRGARRRAGGAARLRAALERKYSPDQPRDDHGRWTGGGGGGQSRLSSHQRVIAAAVRATIAATGEITPNTYLTMRNSGLRLGDVLSPGVYQVEFTPEALPPVNIPIIGTAHSQFVFVDGAGNSHILSGGPGGSNDLQLSVINGNFDSEGAHSLGSVVGQRGETISINNVTLPSGQTPQDTWEKMNQLAEQINSAKLNYNATGENSNSLFYTIAKHGDIGVDMSRITPGDSLDLISVMRGRVPMKGPFTGVANSPNASH